MNANSPWVGMVGVIIGAGSAIIAQLISSGRARDQDVKRLASEEKRFSDQMIMAKREASLDFKRELYVKFLTLSDNPCFNLGALSESDYQLDPDWKSKIPTPTPKTFQKIDSIINMIGLLDDRDIAEMAHDLISKLIYVNRQLIEAETLPYEDRIHICQAPALLWFQIRERMREDLNH